MSDSGGRGDPKRLAHGTQDAVSVKDRHSDEGFPTILSYWPSGDQVGRSRKNRGFLLNG
jgi:hypothetical protein